MDPTFKPKNAFFSQNLNLKKRFKKIYKTSNTKTNPLFFSAFISFYNNFLYTPIKDPEFKLWSRIQHINRIQIRIGQSESANKLDPDRFRSILLTAPPKNEEKCTIPLKKNKISHLFKKRSHVCPPTISQPTGSISKLKRSHKFAAAQVAYFQFSQGGTGV